MAARSSSACAAVVAASAALAAVPLLAAGPSQAAVSGDELKLTFSDGQLRQNAGGTALDIREVTANEGTIATVPGRNGHGSAARFPVFQVDTPPQAVITVVDPAGVDDLDPGTSSFRFGAQFALDSESQGSPTDDGNNLVQRGLFSATTQYKLQVDDAHPSCRIKGRAGAVSVRSRRAVTPGTWYRAVCVRNGSTVRLVVQRLSDKKRWVYAASGATGSLQPDTSRVPLSVGGKVSNRRTIEAGDSDQFNGLVDNVFLDIT